MANACGLLLGTLLSGVLYQQAGVAASLWGAVVLAGLAGIGAMFLPVTADVVRNEGRRLTRGHHDAADHSYSSSPWSLS
jgi:hypothetical protein